MLRRLLLLAFLVAAPAAMAQNGSFQNWCQAGNTLASVSGISSSNPLQGSFPRCKVSVFITGSSTPATLFSVVNGSVPLANPFCASAEGSFLLFASQSAQYDITISNDASCNPSPTYPQLPAPFTWNDAAVSGTGGGGGGSSVLLQTNGVTNSNQALLNVAQGVGLSITNVLGVTTFVNTGVLSITTDSQSAVTGAFTNNPHDYGLNGVTQIIGGSGTLAVTCNTTGTCKLGNTLNFFQSNPVAASNANAITIRDSFGNAIGLNNGSPYNDYIGLATGTGSTAATLIISDVPKFEFDLAGSIISTWTTTGISFGKPLTITGSVTATGNSQVANLTVTGTCTGCATGSIATITGTANQISVTAGSNPVLSIPTTFAINNEQQSQLANGNTVLQQTRFTDSAPTGFFLLGRSAGLATVYSVSVLGDGFFNSLATSNATTAGYLGVQQGPDPLAACQAAAPANVICLFAPTTITAEYGIGLPGTGPASANGSMLLFPALAGSESLTSFIALSGSTAANVACGTVSLAGMANGILAAGDGNGCLKSSGVNVSTVLPSIKGPASAFTTTSLTAVSVYTYTSSIAGATTVWIHCAGAYKFTGTQENAAFDLNFSSVPTSIFLNVFIGANATTQTMTYGRQTVNGSLVTSAATAATTGVYYPVTIDGTVVTNSATTFDFQTATSNAAGTINIDANSIVCSVK